MKNIWKTTLSSIFVFVVLVMAANAQITSVYQIRDVKETDKHFEALKNLVNNYGAFEPFPDATFRANEPLTRGEFAKQLERGFGKMSRWYARSKNVKIKKFSLNKPYPGGAAVRSIKELKDLPPTNEYYEPVRTLMEDYGIDISDAGFFSPNKAVTEKEFAAWIGAIFEVEFNLTPSPTRAITRSGWIRVMSSAFDSVIRKIDKMAENKSEPEKTKTPPVERKVEPPPTPTKSKLEIIQSLPSRGKAQITGKKSFYLPDNPCADLSSASADLKIAVEKGGIWGSYKMNKGDTGDIVYETNNTCEKGKLVLLRVGTAIVTIGANDVKKIK